jgi:hypothetical protein
MNISEHISESLETIFWVKILKYLDAEAEPDPGSGNIFDLGSGILDVKDSDLRSWINILDPQHCFFVQVHRKHIPDSG